MRSNYLFTSESVSEGHPDKVADQISDAIVDLFIGKDPEARVACETLVTTQPHRPRRRDPLQGAFDEEQFRTRTAGRRACATRSRRSCADVVQQDRLRAGRLPLATCRFRQSPARPVRAYRAGRRRERQQGRGRRRPGHHVRLCACDETPDLMPATLYYSHRILERLAADRHSGAAPLPRARRQEPGDAALRERRAGRRDRARRLDPARAGLLRRRADGSDPASQELRDYVVGVFARRAARRLHHRRRPGSTSIRPAGSRSAGPDGDAGLTGRKIIVDTYGGAAPHGGGAFSGKDPTKVDRSAAYVARYLAKNIVAAGPRQALHDPALLRDRRRRAAVALCRPARHRAERRHRRRGSRRCCRRWCG